MKNAMRVYISSLLCIQVPKLMFKVEAIEIY